CTNCSVNRMFFPKFYRRAIPPDRSVEIVRAKKNRSACGAVGSGATRLRCAHRPQQSSGKRRGTQHNYNSKTEIDEVVADGGMNVVTIHSPRIDMSVGPRAAPQDAPNARLTNILTAIFFPVGVQKLLLLVDR